MGLDMYLVKAKRVLPECSKNEVLLMELANHWISYIENEEDCTFEEYCGASNDILEEVGGLDAVKNAAELVKPNLVTLGEFIIETKKGKNLFLFELFGTTLDIGVKPTISISGSWTAFKTERMIVKNMKSQSPIF